MTAFDTTTMTMDQLDNLNIDELLGNNLADYDISSNLSDGSYLFYIEDFDVKKFAAKPEENKKASLNINIKFNVVSALQLADANEDASAVVGRKHFESYNVISDFGIANLIKLMLGIMGISFKDKAAIASLSQSPNQLLNDMKAGNVIFGAQIKNVERNGYDNCNIVLKEKAFVSMHDALNLTAG